MAFTLLYSSANQLMLLAIFTGSVHYSVMGTGPLFFWLIVIYSPAQKFSCASSGHFEPDLSPPD